MKDFKYKLSLHFIKQLIKIAKYLGFDVPPVVAVCGIVRKNNKILAIDLNYRKGIALPGGRLEREETLEGGLIREFNEETGANISKLKYFASFALKKSDFVGLTACFEVTLKPKQKFRTSEEGKPIWVTPEYFIKNASYIDNKYFVKKYFKL